MKKDKRILGIVLISISIILAIVSIAEILPVAIIIFILGILSLMNPNENKIEAIRYDKFKKREVNWYEKK